MLSAKLLALKRFSHGLHGLRGLMKPVPLILVFAVWLAQAGASRQALQTASIEGVVVKTGIADVTIQFPGLRNRKTNVAPGVGEPLAGVTVELTAVDGGRVRSYTMKTGRDGKFQFRNLPAEAGYQLVAILFRTICRDSTVSHRQACPEYRSRLLPANR